MLRNIIKIDQGKCNGCGLCAAACHEGAIGMENGKAKLLREDYCDGLGDCLPACPTGAITFEEREAPAYDEAAVKRAQAAKRAEPSGCPGSRARALRPQTQAQPQDVQDAQSELMQWPVQIRLVPITAPYFAGADLLIAADCAAYACANFHSRFMKNRVTIIGCPKLDDTDYSEKLTAILQANDIKSVTVVRMEVPCCGGLKRAVEQAVENCGKQIEYRAVTLSTDGTVLA